MVMLCNSTPTRPASCAHLDQLEQQRVIGILITPFDAAIPRLTALVARGTPVVLVDRAADRAACSVAVDDQLGGRLAGTHLIEPGHRRIAFIGGPFIDAAGGRPAWRASPAPSPRRAHRAGRASTPAVRAGGDVTGRLVDARADRRADRGRRWRRCSRARPTAAFSPTTCSPWDSCRRWPRAGCGCRTTWRSSATTTSTSPRRRPYPCRRSGSRRELLGRSGDGPAAGGGRGGRPASPPAGHLPAGPDRPESSDLQARLTDALREPARLARRPRRLPAGRRRRRLVPARPAAAGERAPAEDGQAPMWCSGAPRTSRRTSRSSGTSGRSASPGCASCSSMPRAGVARISST